MKVILVGMSKTGTKSMSEALSLLGYKTYDWMEHFWYFGDDWVRIMREGGTKEDFRKMYENVDACTDAPCNYYWEEMIEAFPDAKVILTIRDEDTWVPSRRSQFESYDNDILFRMMLCLTYSGWKFATFMFYEFKHLGNQRSNWPWSNFTQYSDDTLRQIYRKHNTNIIQKCPKKNLLVCSVKEGWKPLCEFLEVEAPLKEFPRRNKGASLLADFRQENKIMRRMQKELYFSLACILGLASFALYKFQIWVC